MALRLLLVLVVLLALGPARRAEAALPGNPLAQGPWFVDRQWDPANREMRAAQAAGRVAVADALRTIADVPRAKWLYAGSSERDVRRYLERLDLQGAPGTQAVFATHALPHDGCGRYDAGGRAADTRFRAWARGVARGIGSHPAAIFLESDGLGTAHTCLHAAAPARRLGLLRFATQVLGAQPRTGVYIDAGAGDWLPVRTAAALLRRAGVAGARGFALNITHYDWTRAEVAYGVKLSRLVGGKPFVVNTAYNGLGPLVPRSRKRWGNEIWCNPTGRALGPVSTLSTPHPLVDALFWIGGPGFSDGPCAGFPGARPGPPVGTWWPAWALELVANARRAPDFPVYAGGG